MNHKEASILKNNVLPSHYIVRGVDRDLNNLTSHLIPNLNILPIFIVTFVVKYDKDEAHTDEIIDASKAPVFNSNSRPYIITNLDTI